MTPKEVRVVLVTGIGSGIGLACGLRFARDGFRVCGVDRAPTEASRGVVRDSGGLCFERDVRDFAGAHGAVDDLIGAYQRLDALVTCAGMSRDGRVARLSEEEWDDVMEVDLKGTFNYIAAVASHFQAIGGGRIVTIASTTALRARGGLANYVAAKAGVIGLTRAAARDLGKYNVNVNAVAPGLVRTALAEKIPPETKQKLLDETCLGRFAEPEDVAAVVRFLCSEEARHITGEVIRVDGGQLA